jgi:hypothetical protein
MAYTQHIDMRQFFFFLNQLIVSLSTKLRTYIQIYLFFSFFYQFFVMVYVVDECKARERERESKKINTFIEQKIVTSLFQGKRQHIASI